MAIIAVIRLYEKTIDKIMFYCHYILYINRNLNSGQMSIKNWLDHLLLLNYLHIMLSKEPSDNIEESCRDNTHLNILKDCFGMCKNSC